MAIQSINPATGTILRTFEPLSEEAVKARIALAHEAFLDYRNLPLAHRALCMRKLAGLLEYEQEDLAALITRETGKTIVSARAELAECAAACRFYAENASRMLADEPISAGGNNSFIRWEPLGVILAVMPCNSPFWQVFRFLAPTLMAGNVCLLKHASNVPLCALTIEALVRRAGFPRGTFQTLLIGAGQVEHVLADKRVAAVVFNGSEAAGRAIAAQAGWLIKRCVLELGGADPFVVMPSADLDAAVAAAVQSRILNNGQSAIAAKPFVIHEAVYDAFETRFVAAMEALQIGDPMKDATELGPLATVQAAICLDRQVQSARQAGGTILTGGEPMVGAGNFYEPTVIAGLPRTAAIAAEDFFGPVALLFRASSLDEAIEIANDTSFSLGASVWTSEATERTRLAAEIVCGQVFVNATVTSGLPPGRVKRSGYFRDVLKGKTVVFTEPLEPLETAHVIPPLVREPALTPEPYDSTQFRHAFSTALSEADQSKKELPPAPGRVR